MLTKTDAELLEFPRILELLAQEMRLSDDVASLSSRPFLSLPEARSALDETDEALMLLSRLGRPLLSLTESPALELSRLEKGGTLDVAGLVTIARLLASLASFRAYGAEVKDKGLTAPFLTAKSALVADLSSLARRIAHVLSPEGTIADTASPLLNTLRRKIFVTEASIRKILADLVAKNAGRLSESLVTQRYDHDTLPVKNDFKNQVDGSIIDASKSGETVYIEPRAVAEAKARISALREEEAREVARILRETSDEIRPFTADLESGYSLLLDDDFIFAKARLAEQLHLSNAELHESTGCEIYGLFHPLLNVPEIIKNDIVLDTSIRSVVITGPNTGGKTVLLKALGLTALMARFGLLLPLSARSRVPFFTNVLADIGDEQSIAQNLSTFSAHMTRIARMLKDADGGTLVILDELGSGTDPAEGSALAVAILDKFLAEGALAFASTHYSELKLHAYKVTGMLNASVSFNPETLQPTYRLLLGIPGESNALKIARRLGFPADVIDEAEQNTLEEDQVLDKAIASLSEETRLLDERLRALDEEKKSLDEAKAAADERNASLIAKQAKFEREARMKQDELVRTTEARLNALLASLAAKAQEIKPHEIAEAKASLEAERAPRAEDVPADDGGALSPGDVVYLKSTGSFGVVESVQKTRKGLSFTVTVGNLTMSLSRSELVRTGRKDAVALDTQKMYTGSVKLASVKSSRLDLRGMRYEDASVALKKFFDDAIVANYHEVTIIHGFGTGVIRTLVQDYLKTARGVASYRYGGATEGGLGATIVTLKP